MSKDERRPNLLLRQARGGLSQGSLAELVNAEIYRATAHVGAITAKSISDWERGWYWWPAAHVRSALCVVLKAAGPEELGFARRRAAQRQAAAERPISRLIQPDSLVDVANSVVDLQVGTIGYLEVPGGRAFLGAGIVAHYCDAHPAGHDRVTPSLADDATTALTRPDLRTLLIAQVPESEERERYLTDGREFVAQRPAPGDIPTAYLLDDFTIGIIWAITNTDTEAPRVWSVPAFLDAGLGCQLDDFPEA